MSNTAKHPRESTSAPWIQTASGREWDLIAPEPSAVHWPDIAEHLAKICRFNGATLPFYSVAQHCCHVADALPPDYRLHGLLHDAHEAVIGDVTAPMKLALAALGAGDAMEILAEITDKALFTAAGLAHPLTGAAKVAVHQADMALLATERRDLLATPRGTRKWGALPQPLPGIIKPWNWTRAMDQWLERFDRYATKPTNTTLFS